MKPSGCRPARPGIVRFLLLSAILSCLVQAPAWAKMVWDPITPEERAAKDCRYYPGASAEMLFVRQVLDSSGKDEWTDCYRRIKIYSFKGAEELGVMNIDYPTGQRVWDYGARVTKPDGTSAEYDRKQFTEVVAAKLKNSKWKRLTLAVPALEAGDILELKWSASLDSEAFYYSWWYSQLNLPVRRYNFKVKSSAHDCRLTWFNSGNEVDKNAKRGEIQLNLQFLLPFEEEPYMPPERDVRSWFLLLYTDLALRWYSDNDVWKSISSYHEEEFRLSTKPDATLKAKAMELVAGAASDDEKLARLYEFCQREISNLDYFDSAELQPAKKRLDEGKEQSPKGTLSHAAGYSRHINELFGSLAKAAGFEVTLGRSSSRHVTMQVKNANGWMFLPDDFICVRVGGEWRRYAPGDYLVPAGMIDPSNELAPALICLQDKAVIEDNKASGPDRSPVNRKGRFVLDADGNLEGEVEVTMDGHPAIRNRKTWHGQLQPEIDRTYIEKITQRLPSAEVTDLKWENLRDNRAPVKVRYRLKVPAYADVIGSKIVLPLDVFQRNVPAVFTSDARFSPIYFDYAWSEHDDLEIILPEGSRLEAPGAPKDVGEANDPFGANYRVTYQPKSRTVVYKRDFVVGRNGATAFQVNSYKTIKRRFDAIKHSDDHTLVVNTEPAPAQAGH